MADYKKYINALRKCAKEHDNDTTYTGHIRVSDLCRDTADLLEVLEQEPVLDKIRAELIQSIQNGMLKIEGGNEELFRIIDKYKTESEVEK